MQRILFCLLALLLSCSTAPINPKESRLRICFNTYPMTADPRKSGDFVSATLICMIFEGMTRCTPDGTVEPALAERVDLSSDQLTYTFHLRPSFWSDGAPVTAYDFEKSWKRNLDPNFPSLCSYLFYSIKNGEKAYKRQAPLEEIAIKALDDSTLEVVLERPNPIFLSLTAFPAYLPIPSHADSQFEQFGSSNQFISNGPFCIERVQPNSEIILKKNEGFWNRDSIRLQKIDIAIVGSETTALKMFERGEIDWLGGAISPLPTDSLQKMGKRNLLRHYPMAATTFCAFKTNHPLLKNKNLRRALSLAINRTEIVEKITQMGEGAATRCIPPALIGFREKTLYQAFDPELARLHLEKALQELGLKNEEMTGLILSFRAAQIDRQLAQAIQRQWKETLDLDISLDQCEQKSFKERLHQRDFQIALSFWIAQFSDPINILERFQDESNFKNYSGWHSEEFSSLVQQINAENDKLTRLYLIEEAEQLFMEEMPLAPIYHWSNPSLCQPTVQNMQTTPNGGVLFERCWISDPISAKGL